MQNSQIFKTTLLGRHDPVKHWYTNTPELWKLGLIYCYFIQICFYFMWGLQF